MPGESAPGSAHCLQLVIPADALAVRSALATLCDALILRSLPPAQRGTAELVLAEVLNNIVEHAYAARTGEIEITLRRRDEGLVCQIVDHGTGMPEGRAPPGHLPDATRDDPPEGGFGWYLIRALSQDLDYSCADGRNRLTFRLTTPPSG